MICVECGRQHGDEDACRHCGHVVVPASSDWQKDAANAARELLKAARAKKHLRVVKDEGEK